MAGLRRLRQDLPGLDAARRQAGRVRGPAPLRGPGSPWPPASCSRSAAGLLLLGAECATRTAASRVRVGRPDPASRRPLADAERAPSPGSRLPAEIDALEARVCPSGPAGHALSKDDQALLARVAEMIRESEARQDGRLDASLGDLDQKQEAQRRYDMARIARRPLLPRRQERPACRAHHRAHGLRARGCAAEMRPCLRALPAPGSPLPSSCRRASAAQGPPLARAALELFEAAARPGRGPGQPARDRRRPAAAPSPRAAITCRATARSSCSPRACCRARATSWSSARGRRPKAARRSTSRAHVEGPGGPDEEAAASVAEHARRVLAAAREPRSHVHGPRRRGPARPTSSWPIEQQVLEFQREAEEARQNAEREFERISQGIRERMAPLPAPPAPVPQASARARRPAPQAPPAGPAAPIPAPVPRPPREPLPPGVPAPPTSIAGVPLPQPPPWRFWFDGGPPDAANAGQGHRRRARGRRSRSSRARGRASRGVAPGEYVTVAVDFVPAGVFVSQVRPARTVVVRARKQDLDARSRGQLSADDLRRRVEVTEY